MTTEELRSLAEKATPGPWMVQDGCSWRRIGTHFHDGDVVCPTNQRDGHPDLTARRADLDYIAAANPARIIALIATNAALLAALRDTVHIARNGCLVPPDGGSPTEAEAELCDEIADRIKARIAPLLADPTA